MLRRGLDHDEVQAQLPSYLLGDIDADLAVEIEDHLASCSECREKEDRLAEALGSLGTLVPAAEPPPSLRARFLDEIATTDPTAAPAPFHEVIQLAGRPGRLPRWVNFALAAAAVAVLALAALAGILQHQLGQSRSQLSVAQLRLTEMNSILSEPSGALPMTADPPAGAYGTLYLANTGNRGVLVVDHLPPTPAGQSYHVWLIQGNQWVAAGEIAAGQDGQAETIVTTPNPISSYEALGITSEPAHSQVDHPAGPVVIRCRLGAEYTPYS